MLALSSCKSEKWQCKRCAILTSELCQPFLLMKYSRILDSLLLPKTLESEKLLCGWRKVARKPLQKRPFATDQQCATSVQRCKQIHPTAIRSRMRVYIKQHDLKSTRAKLFFLRKIGNVAHLSGNVMGRSYVGRLPLRRLLRSINRETEEAAIAIGGIVPNNWQSFRRSCVIAEHPVTPSPLPKKKMKESWKKVFQMILTEKCTKKKSS